MNKKIFLAIVLLIILCISTAFANNLILAPSGSNLHTGEVRAEGAVGMNDSNNRFYWLGFGISQLEVNLLSADRVVGKDVDIVSLQYHFLPQTGVTPSVSFGIWDVFDDTDDGIAPYAAATKEIISDFGIIESLELTGGFGFNGIDGIFGGITMKLPAKISLCAEYFNDKINTSIGFSIGSFAAVKLYRIESDYYYGIQFTPFSF